MCATPKLPKMDEMDVEIFQVFLSFYTDKI